VACCACMAEICVSMCHVLCGGADVVSLTPLPGNDSQNLHRDGGNIDYIIACGRESHCCLSHADSLAACCVFDLLHPPAH
jgi:hypothetical protein